MTFCEPRLAPCLPCARQEPPAERRARLPQRAERLLGVGLVSSCALPLREVPTERKPVGRFPPPCTPRPEFTSRGGSGGHGWVPRAHWLEGFF